MRGAFSIILAMVVLIVVAVLSILTLSTTAQTTEVTQNRYLREQVELLAYSGIKVAYSMLKKNSSLNRIELDMSEFSNVLQCFDITVDVASKFKDEVFLLDTYVDSNNKCNIAPSIRFHRRTTQEIY